MYEGLGVGDERGPTTYVFLSSRISDRGVESSSLSALDFPFGERIRSGVNFAAESMHHGGEAGIGSFDSRVISNGRDIMATVA